MIARPGKFREHWNVVRDAAVGAAVLIYFAGFVYLYYYLQSFGVSVIAIQLAPQHIFTFAYDVLTHQIVATVLVILVVFVLASGYNALMGRLSVEDHSQQPHHRRRHALHIHPAEWRALQRWLVMLAGIVLILLTFPLSFWWAHEVARADSAVLFDRSHVGSRPHLRLIENQTGSLATSTAEFRNIVNAVNHAGADGRAIKVAESPDQVFILVGAQLKPNEDPRQRLAGDQVFAIDKALIAIQEDF